MTTTTNAERLALAERIDKSRHLDCMDEPALPEMSLEERDLIVAALRAQPAEIRPVAQVVEQLDGNEARILWLFNPVPEGQELLWEHGDAPATPLQPGVPGEQSVEAALRDNLREAWSGMTMIREAIETLGPVGALPASEHLDGPTFMIEAEALVRGIMKLASPQQPAEAGAVVAETIERCAQVAETSTFGFSESMPVKDMIAHTCWSISRAIRALATPDPTAQAMYEREVHSERPADPTAGKAAGEPVTIDHDGFVGTIQGSYTTREGKRGVVLQQVGTRVVHVYGEKWIKPPRPALNDPVVDPRNSDEGDEPSIFDRKVKFEEDWSAEPTLRELVVAYYSQHMTETDATAAATAYLDGLSPATAPAVSGEVRDRIVSAIWEHVTAHCDDERCSTWIDGAYDAADAIHPHFADQSAALAEARKALSMLYELCTVGASDNAFHNGVTDSTGSIDEGDVRAGEYIDFARAVIDRIDERKS